MRRFKSILIVDDDADVRESVSDLLSFEGHPNIVAANGIEALAALERCETPTLVLLDSVMPGIDNATFLEKLGRLESPESIQVVFISGHRGTHPESPLVIGELPKPFDIGALLALVAARPGSG
ncbi:MAG TPA: response regulator [Anaeromyxobacteraceae bacterium]|nr:response regulator [Anaeromyxobacteraceae bacterium]